jgi:hypothetical protein
VNRIRPITRIAFAFSFALQAVGCHSTPTVEPESDYIEMRPLIYNYDTVFDCVAEAITEEGLSVKEADRVHGTLESVVVPGAEDRLKGLQSGARIKARVVTEGPKDFTIRVTATRLERELNRDNSTSEWRYAGRDEDLLAKFKKRFDRQVDKRYRSPDRGG